MGNLGATGSGCFVHGSIVSHGTDTSGLLTGPLLYSGAGFGNAGSMATGTVKFYQDTKGWGAISSDELPDGCDAWVHFSVIAGEGYRSLEAGQRVEFSYEAAQQDSFRYRATLVRVL